MTTNTELAHRHEHVCCVCEQVFECMRANCTIVDGYAICTSIDCVSSFEADVYNNERHPMGCVCQDCNE
jgi:hypothetical protein